MQEAFLNALRRPPADESGLLTWLGVLARHEAIRGGMREDHRRERERAVAASEGYWAESAEAREQVAEVLRLLESLPDPYREVLRLRYIDELEIDEIAQRLGRSRGTVGSQIKRGLDRLRERLAPEQERRRGLRGLVVMLLGSREERRLVRWTTRAALACACAVPLILVWRGGAENADASEVAGHPVPSSTHLIENASGSSSRQAAPPLDPPRPEPSVAAPSGTVDPEVSVWLTSVQGVVLGPDGEPLAGASLRAGQEGETPGRVVGTSDEAGRFQLDGLDGRQWLWADTEGHRCSKQHLLATASSGREIVLHTGERLDARQGRVLSADGVPMAGARITFLDSVAETKPWLGDQGTIERVFWEYRHTVETAPDGTFAFGLSTDDKCRMVIEVHGLPPTLLTYYKPQETPCTDFFLPRGGRLRGRVLTADDSPVPGALVRVELPRPYVPLDTSTDERGEFAFDAVPCGPYELVASHASGQALSSRLVGELEDGASLTRDIRLSAAGMLRGIVIAEGAEERPVAGWSVELERTRTEHFPDRRLATTADDGRFAFPGCLPGEEYLLILRAPDSAHLNWAGRVRMGDSAEFSLHVRAAEWEPSRLEGILDAGQPEDCPSFLELWSDALMRRWMTRVDPVTGRYSFAGVPPGAYVLLGWTKRCGPVEVESVSLEPGRTARLDATLRAPGTLRVRIAVPADVAADRVDALWFGPSMQGAKPYAMRKMSPGREALEFVAEVPPGEHEYRVRIDTQIFDVRRAQVREGEVTEELVMIPPFVLVAFRLGLPRTLPEWDAPKIIARGEREWRPSRGHAVFVQTERLRLRLPRDVTEVEVRFESGLHGVWRGSLETVPWSTELWLPLEEPDLAPR